MPPLRYRRTFRKNKVSTKTNRDLTHDVSVIKTKLRDLQGEIKAEDFNHTVNPPLPVLGTPAYHVTDIPQGDASNQRVGDEIKIVSLMSRGYFVRLADDCNIRIIILQSKFNDGANPLLGDIVNQPTVIDSFRNRGNLKGYRVLYDKTLTLNTYKPRAFYKYYNNKLNSKVQYDGPLGSQHTFGDYHVFIYSTAVCQNEGITRIKYIDN